MYQIAFMKSDDKGVVWEATELTKKKFGVPVGKFVNGVLRSYIRELESDILELKENDKEDILLSYPRWFYDKIKSEYEEESNLFLESLKKIPYISFRVNTLKYSEEEFEKLLVTLNINIIKKLIQCTI